MVIGALAGVLWSVAVRGADPSFIDVCWGAGFVVVAAVSYALSPERPLLVVLAAVWGLRLATYLYWRWRRTGPDPRYKRISATRAFGLQTPLLLLVSLPLQLGQVYDERLSALNVIGALLTLFGIAFETTADAQLMRFKADAANAGQVMDRGLWRYTRHPNYFGDFCVWWGLFLVSVSNAVTVIGIVGPIVMSFLLMRYSGVGPLERQLNRTNPQYAEYTTRTSAFFPSRPKPLSR